MVHAATMYDWERRYGAEVVSMTGSFVEMTVSRPPLDRERAMALAREQYLYCGDIVWQGTESLEALAASLIDAPVWYFWWD